MGRMPGLIFSHLCPDTVCELVVAGRGGQINRLAGDLLSWFESAGLPLGRRPRGHCNGFFVFGNSAGTLGQLDGLRGVVVPGVFVRCINQSQAVGCVPPLRSTPQRFAVMLNRSTNFTLLLEEFRKVPV